MRQIYPKTYKNALEAYKNAVSSQSGYLMINLRCETNDKQRLRTGIFRRTLTIFINESPVKKRTGAAFASKGPPTSLQKNILDKPSPELIRCICDCAHNVL